MDVQLFARELERQHSVVRAEIAPTRHFSPDILHRTLNNILNDVDQRLVAVTMAGTSFEGETIRLIRIGKSNLSVLLWSQMHGDESTATMAIVDILRYLTMRKDDPPVRAILSSLTLHFLPMLNPDGAARCQRRTAQVIDMNRDALALQTPEARILKNLQQTLKPTFGFNLHDQELSTVGTSKELAAIALLAPAFDPLKSENDVRTRAKHLASVFAEIMKERVPGKIARYDDSFEPRAFGDNMQQWGTSTLLVESGHAMNDPQKESIRRLNFVGILSSLYAIATGAYQSFDISSYERLPFNTKKAYDVIIRNVKADYGRGRLTEVDLGVSYQIDTHSEMPPRLVDLGDLSTFVGLKEIDASGKTVPASVLFLGNAFDWEKYFS
ncbi:MAG: peptidase M14 [Ignavibacteriae bacterium]|nr:peptidase M14 [Ignavibacteriota bacterium]